MGATHSARKAAAALSGATSSSGRGRTQRDLEEEKAPELSSDNKQALRRPGETNREKGSVSRDSASYTLHFAVV